MTLGAPPRFILHLDREEAGAARGRARRRGTAIVRGRPGPGPDSVGGRLASDLEWEGRKSDSGRLKPNGLLAHLWALAPSTNSAVPEKFQPIASLLSQNKHRPQTNNPPLACAHSLIPS